MPRQLVVVNYTFDVAQTVTQISFLHCYAFISCPLDHLLKVKNPTPPKLRFVSPPRLRGGVRGGVLLL